MPRPIMFAETQKYAIFADLLQPLTLTCAVPCSRTPAIHVFLALESQKLATRVPKTHYLYIPPLAWKS